MTASPLRVEVTVPATDAVTLSGSGTIMLERARGEDLTVRLSGSGVVGANGEVQRLDATLSGSGSLELRALLAREVTATETGSGVLRVHASDARRLDSRNRHDRLPRRPRHRHA